MGIMQLLCYDEVTRFSMIIASQGIIIAKSIIATSVLKSQSGNSQTPGKFQRDGVSMTVCKDAMTKANAYVAD